MGNICNFDEWKFINEKKFNAEIKDIEKDEEVSDIKDNIVVKETENGEPIIYTIDGTSITSNQKEVSVGVNGENKGLPEDNVEEITDPQLKSDIKKAAYSIRDIKDRLHAKEILRLTGGDITDATDEIRAIIDAAHKTQETNEKACPKSLASTLGNESFKYIKIPRRTWKGKYTLSPKNIKDIYNTKSHTIGKGEYLLPFLFSDVYKNQSYGDKAKGDNYLIDGDNKYILEVKGSGAMMYFTNYSKKSGGATLYLENSKSIQNEENIEDIYKYAIAASLLDYAKKQMKEMYFGGYLCLFAELESKIKNTNDNKETTPIGMLFINIKDIPDSDIYISSSDPFKNTGLLQKIKDIIVIDDKDYINGTDFEYTCIGESKPYIYCRLKKEHINTILKIKGLSPLDKRTDKKNKNIGKTKYEDKTIFRKIQNTDNSNDENFEESIVLNFERFINEIYSSAK
jgi:hypothetical protein